MKYVLLLGRILFSAIFILSIFGHFSRFDIDYAALKGVPMANILVPLAGIIAFLGGQSVLLGYKARCGVWLIVLFLIPVTFWMHDFWNAADPLEAVMQQANFFKNLSMLGAALIISFFGTGPLSLDNRPCCDTKHHKHNNKEDRG